MKFRQVLNEKSYFGAGCRSELGGEIMASGFKKAFLCCDKVLEECGVCDKVEKEIPIEFYLFDSIVQNPTVASVKKGVDEFKESGADFIIAVGGGSSIDTAKAIAIIAANPEHSEVVTLEGLSDTKNPSIPIFAMPTTAGTAAEVTINYVITDEKKNRKMVCVDPHDIPKIAFVDSELMETMPKLVAASTGMDALTHAIEGYITKGATPLSDMFHLKAIELISKNLKAAVEGDKAALEKVALGQYTAGMGFSNSGLGLVHSMAHPLGALYDTPHGVANAVLLPSVMAFNADSTGERFKAIAKALGVENVSNNADEFRKEAIEAVKKLGEAVGIQESLKEIVKEKDLSFLADSALADACFGGNPRAATKDDIIAIYKSLM